MVKKRKTVQTSAAVVEPIATESATIVDDLRARLEEIKNYDGVVGYILRNSNSAAIDLKDPAQIINYAVLSFSAIDAGQEFSKLFSLGNVQSILVEGKSIKMLSMTVHENRVSVFMGKNVDSTKVLEKLLAT